MHRLPQPKACSFVGEGNEMLVVRYNNRGEPFREGVELIFNNHNYENIAGVFLDDHEGRKVYEFLHERYGKPTTKTPAADARDLLNYEAMIASDKLLKLGWRPTRADLETLRNAMHRAARLIESGEEK